MTLSVSERKGHVLSGVGSIRRMLCQICDNTKVCEWCPDTVTIWVSAARWARKTEQSLNGTALTSRYEFDRERQIGWKAVTYFFVYNIVIKLHYYYGLSQAVSPVPRLT